jgi:outer membrane protein assembly factor BamB
MHWLRSLGFLLLCCSGATAGDWPQWLGPNRDASSPERVVPWKEAPKFLWSVEVGEGNSSPVVANGRVFVHAKVKDKDAEVLFAIDAKKGKILWYAEYEREAFKSLYGNGPRATPAVDGDHVYTFGITGVLSCWEAATGKKVWQYPALSGKNLFFGMACSPLVDGDRVLVNIGGKGNSVVAYNKNTGLGIWWGQDDRASYSSPILVGKGQERQVIFLTGDGLISLNATDGSLFWRYPLVDKLLESSTTPVLAGDILLASSITYGSVGLRLESKDGKPTASEIWKNPELTSYFTTPVPVGPEHIYFVKGTKPPALFNRATLHCVEAKTGKDLWRKPQTVGKYHASLLRTGDNKLLMLEEAGNLVLVDPSPQEYRELARSAVCGETWAHPALADGKLYVRDNKRLICLQLADAGPGNGR